MCIDTGIDPCRGKFVNGSEVEVVELCDCPSTMECSNNWNIKKRVISRNFNATDGGKTKCKESQNIVWGKNEGLTLLRVEWISLQT